MKEFVPDLSPLTDDTSGTHNLYRNYLKRVFDVVTVLLSAPIVVPAVALLALPIFVYDRKSPFYWSERVGRKGTRFRMLKLRTMRADADAYLQWYLAQNVDASAEWDVSQKLKSDPRITPAGRLLRKYSIDELPQLWNVLRGDMSVVGPRPMMPDQRTMYPGEAYFLLRPGLTGPWQVAARNDSTFVERANFDEDYARRLSFSTDLKLILDTTWVVVHGTGY